MNLGKIFGWILVVAGVALIVWTLYYSFNIFTGKSDIPGPGFFKFETAETQTPVTGKTPVDSLDAQGLGNVIGEQLKGMLPTDFLPKSMNSGIWALLAWILISGGGQISNLGIKIIKG
ncbi:MAG: hypothetical protein WC514_02300 [Candidatus Paceibacterota bacterium]